MTDSEPPIEQVVADLRKLADEAEEDLEQRKETTDLTDVDPSQMAYAEMQGMRRAFVQAWRLAISKRKETPTTSGDDSVLRCPDCGSDQIESVDWGDQGTLYSCQDCDYDIVP